MSRLKDDVMHVKYRCTKCGAEDTGKFFTDVAEDHPYPAINCWKCGAGRGKDLREMVALQIGMMPVFGAEEAEGA